LKIAIITRPDDRSPKVLAKSLKAMCGLLDVECQIFYDISMLIRMQPLRQKLRYPYSKLKRIYSKIKFHKTERIFLKKLATYDIIVISECTPNGFWEGYYAIEVLKSKLKKPVLYYEVYYLGNAPTQIQRLQHEGEPGIDRYDWHLAVTDITEIKSSPLDKWSRIGLNLEHTGLKPIVKEKFLVLIDFEQPGYEQYRNQQIQVLKEIGIPYIELKGSYTIDEIRYLYSQAWVLLIQFPEAFGLPIAECLACGAYIMTPSSAWPMSWRFDENPQIHSEGLLPDFFQVYSSREELKTILINSHLSYDLHTTPFSIFSSFTKQYPHYYYGDPTALNVALAQFSDKRS
jgi:hypothetical protein